MPPSSVDCSIRSNWTGRIHRGHSRTVDRVSVLKRKLMISWASTIMKLPRTSLKMTTNRSCENQHWFSYRVIKICMFQISRHFILAHLPILFFTTNLLPAFFCARPHSGCRCQSSSLCHSRFFHFHFHSRSQRPFEILSQFGANGDL